MAQLSDPIYRDATLPEEIVAYKPYSPAAMLGLVAGIAAALAALTVWDIGWGFLAVPVVSIFFAWKGLGSVRRYDMAGRGAAKTAIALSAAAIIGGTSSYLYLLRTTVPADYRKITYEESLKPGMGGPIPTSARELEGKKVYVQGYMYPTNQSRHMSRFVLCRDNGTCCFGGQPKLNDMIEVKVKKGLTIDHTSSLRGIGGTFHARAEADPGGLGQIIYHIDDADVLH